MWNSGLAEAQVEIKTARRNISNLRYADGITLMTENKEKLKSLFMNGKEESEKAGWKLNLWNTEIIASGPTISWQIDAETMETVTVFIFLGSIIIAVGDCRHEIKRHLLLGRKVMTKLDSILKSLRHYFADKGLSNQSYGFSSSHIWSESWFIKKAEHWKIDALELWCWRRLLRVPWTAGRSKQSILKEISPEYSLEGLMLKLKLQ